MIKVGYTKTDGTDVIHETVQGAVNAEVSIRALQESKKGDSEVDCFYFGNANYRYRVGKICFC